MQLTPLGAEFESIIVGVLLFLAVGFISFGCCFLVTNIYIFYKRRTLRTRMRHERGYNYSNGYYNECDDDNSSFDEFIRNDSKIAYDEEIRRNSKESKSTISSTEITNST